MPTRVLTIRGPFDLRATMAALGSRMPGQPHASDTEAWWIGSGPDGPVTMQLEVGDGRLAAEAWGPGASWALEHLPRLAGADDDPSDFDPPPGLVRELHRRARGLRLGSTARVVDALIPTILGQRVTTAAAKTSYRKLVRRWGRPAPGPIDAWAPPEARDIAGLSYADLHPLGVERSRASIVIEAARRASRLEEIVAMPRDDAYRRLEAVRGVGAWTAASVMGAAWGDRDAVPTGDFHLPNTVAWGLAGEPRADDARMLELLEPYAGHRRRVIILLKQAGVHAPKYGPKAAVQAFDDR